MSKRKPTRPTPEPLRHSTTLYEVDKVPPVTAEQRRRNEEIARAELATTRKVAPCHIEPSDAFYCSCGAEQPAPGAYAAAHWNYELVRPCPGCGANLVLRNGFVRVEQPKRRRKTTKGTRT